MDCPYCDTQAIGHLEKLRPQPGFQGAKENQ